MAGKLYNLARMTTPTTGTGTLTLGAAVSGFLSFVAAGVLDGETVTYAIQDGSASEIGRGVYTASGTTLTRSVLKSTNSNSAISLSGSAQVFITPSAEDFLIATNAQTGTTYTVLQSDLGKLVTFTNAAAVAVTLPQAVTNFSTGWFATLSNIGQSVVTITPTTSTIGGATTFALQPGQSVKVVSDGTNWMVDRGATKAPSNAIINGDFRIAQRGTSFTSATTPANNDDTYVLDRWVLLSDGNDIVDVTQSANVPSGGIYSIALDVETINKKFGVLQIIEQKNCAGLFGQNVVVSFNARVSATTKLDNVKCAIIAWDGTSDSVTSDIVSAWNVEGTNPTLVANWTYENTPSNLGLSTSWARYSVTASVDTASVKNIGVFIWSDVTDTDLGDFLYITDVQIEHGTIASKFLNTPYSEEFAKCQRYYRRLGAGLQGHTVNTTSVDFFAVLDPSMRVAPTLALVSSVVAIVIPASGYTSSGSSMPTNTINANGFRGRIDGFTGMTGSEPAGCNQSADIYTLDAEL